MLTAYIMRMDNGGIGHSSLHNGVNPEQNCTLIDAKDVTQKTTVSLKAFKYEYRNAVPYALESLARKLIEHCLPYFITGTAPRLF